MNVFDLVCFDSAAKSEAIVCTVRGRLQARALATDIAKSRERQVIIRERKEVAERQSIYLIRLPEKEIEKLAENLSRKTAAHAHRAWDCRGSGAVMVVWPEWAPELDQILKFF